MKGDDVRKLPKKLNAEGMKTNWTEVKKFMNPETVYT